MKNVSLRAQTKIMATSKVIYLGDLRTECEHLASGNRIITDAPIDNQGKGEKFSPTDLLATSLASCMMTIMGISARNHGIETLSMQAEVTKVMASNPRRVAEININMILNKELTEKQRVILEKAGLSCPVAKSLSSEIKQGINFKYE